MPPPEASGSLLPAKPRDGASPGSSDAPHATDETPTLLQPSTPTSGVVLCSPRLASSEVLPAGCAGEPYFARLQLECSETGAAPPPRTVQWQPTAFPAGLTLTEQGELLGSEALSPGDHALRARARVTGSEVEVSLQLQVLERCFLFAAAHAPAADGSQVPARILAQRLDVAASLWLPEALSAGGSVLSFDPSADGHWLAAASSSPAGERLLLFHVAGGRVTELRLQHAGAHVAHAFSPDSAQLAVLTDVAPDASSPPQRRLSLVQLAPPIPDAPALALAETFAVPYQTGLGWADEHTLQFIGVSAQFLTFYAPHVVHLPDSSLDSAQLEELLYPMDPADLIRWFHPLPGGFYVMTNALSYVNSSATVAGVHLRAQALSPTYELSAHAQDGRLLLHAPEVSDDAPPTFSAAGCERLLAWSGDGQTLLCLFEGQLVRHQLGEGSLAPQRLDTAWQARSVSRSVLSQQGQWSVVADGDHGLFVLASGTPPPIEPLLAPSAAEPGWDFGVSHDERYVWVQQGRRLSVAPLRAGEAPQLTLISETLAAPATCAEGGLPLPEAWCGAPALQGAVQLRDQGRYLAFGDARGALTLVDLAEPTRRLEASARLADDCTERCVQFQ